MKKLKKITSALGVMLVAVVFAALTTYATAPDDERAEIGSALFQNAVDGEGRQIDWDSLPGEIVAWVEVPGTSIDEPIAQACPDAPNAYLYRDATGQGAYGTPYIDSECSLDSPYVMVYGHHMSDGSVFADFASFIDEAYAKEHDEIIIYQRRGETLHLIPIAVDVVDADRETLAINQEADFSCIISEADLRLAEIKNDRQVFAFATCSYQTKNSRTIVYTQGDNRIRSLEHRVTDDV